MIQAGFDIIENSRLESDSIHNHQFKMISLNGAVLTYDTMNFCIYQSRKLKVFMVVDINYHVISREQVRFHAYMVVESVYSLALEYKQAPQY